MAFVLLAVLLLSACASEGDDGATAADQGSVVSTPSSSTSTSTTSTTSTSTSTTTSTTSTTVPPAPRELGRGNAERAVVALTFDCGSGAGPTPAILDTLKANTIRATFFLTGRWVEKYPDLARRIASEHDIASHSYTHADFTTLTDAQIVQEMEKAEAAIQTASGRGTKPYWRAPYGARNAHILKVVADAGWPVHVYWTVDALDWRDISAEQVRANVAAKLTNGMIVLEHCGSPQTADALPDVIRDISASGRAYVTIAQLVAS